MLKKARTDERRRELQRELAVPPFPEAVRYLWDAFWRIRSRRGAGPLTLGEIADFIRLTGVQLAPWEVEIIERLDNAWRDAGKAQPEEETED